MRIASQRAGDGLGESFPGASAAWACAVDSGSSSSAACSVGTTNMTFFGSFFSKAFVAELCVKLREVKGELPKVAKF